MTYSSLGPRSLDDIRAPRRDFIDELNEAVRRNPVPAALVGVGILWMFMGGAKNTILGKASSSVLGGIGRGAQQASEAASRGVRQAGGAMAESLSGAAETAQAASGTTAAAASSAAETVSQAVASGARSLQASGQEVGKSVQQTLADMFDKQPLLLGAMGAALGAAMAAALPPTPVENRLMGDAAESLKEKAQEVWSETTEQAEAALSKGFQKAAP